MGNQSSKQGLSLFRKQKLMHEFHTFFDLNKNGTLEWKDFAMAREKICGLSGWKPGSEKWLRTHKLFTDLWRLLGDHGDTNMDGKITDEEWLDMWERIDKESKGQKDRNPNSAKTSKTIPSSSSSSLSSKDGDQAVAACAVGLPEWLIRYMEYKFDLYDRTGDGIIDGDEFEYVLSDFGVAAKDARACYLIFSVNEGKRLDREYFHTLCLQFFCSDNRSDLGNFITGRLHFDEVDDGNDDD